MKGRSCVSKEQVEHGFDAGFVNIGECCASLLMSVLWTGLVLIDKVTLDVTLIRFPILMT